MSLLIKGGRIIDPASFTDFIGDILVEGEKISRIAEHIDPPDAACQQIDAQGKIVSPGLIDLHVHLREPGREDEETIESGSRAAVHGGFTCLACMPNTNPVNDNQAVCNFIVSCAAKSALCRIYPVGAISKKQEGKELAEMGDLKDSGAIAFSDDGKSIRDAALMRRALEYSRMLERPIISHCEDTDLSHGGVMHEGLVSTRLGLPPIPAEAESLMVARDIALAELTGGRLHLAHVSSAKSVELVRLAKIRGIKITAEVTPHHFTLTDQAVAGFDTNTKVNPPLRTSQDICALIEGLKDGTIDAIASDHAPHSSAEKELEYTNAPFGLIGLETTLALTISQLVNKGHLTIHQALEKLTINPANILGLPYGRLTEGCWADITIFDSAEQIEIQEATLFSKSKNTPFLGWKLPGKIMATIMNGKVMYKNS
ncbi:MAG: dihydroorotase [Candidatus Schekmanbacteria bacterium]|nr:dihydroorotase [Candidatus Schekmanbacteria bacterium]